MFSCHSQASAILGAVEVRSQLWDISSLSTSCGHSFSVIWSCTWEELIPSLLCVTLTRHPENAIYSVQSVVSSLPSQPIPSDPVKSTV